MSASAPLIGTFKEATCNNLRWFFWLIAIACLGGLAMAQTPTGTIAGAITDSTGATIPACDCHRHQQCDQ